MICDPNDLAFPTQKPFELRDAKGNVSMVEHHWRGGLTKREYFAACALQGLVQTLPSAESVTGVGHGKCAVAHVAVELADALIDALNQEAP